MSKSKSDRRTLTTRESDRPQINTLSTAPTENLFSGKVLRIQLFNYLQSISRRKQFFSTPERKKVAQQNISTCTRSDRKWDWTRGVSGTTQEQKRVYNYLKQRLAFDFSLVWFPYQTILSVRAMIVRGKTARNGIPLNLRKWKSKLSGQTAGWREEEECPIKIHRMSSRGEKGVVRRWGKW